MFRLALGALLLISGLSSPGSAAAADPAPAATHAGAIDEGAQLVFLLQYVGSDYALAVNGGRVVDEAEYAENREFARLIVEKLERLKVRIPPSKLGPIADAVGQLDALVGSLGEPQLVRELSEAAIPRLIDALDLHSFPRERPDPERARALYAENCATCHGAHGAGDGPRAKDLDPPPARFTDRARMTTTAPYVFYNAITLGVANTAMASFDYVPDQDRWALAFYLWTFVADEAKAAPPPIVLSQRDLATRSSVDLAPEVVRRAATGGRTIDPEEAMRWIAAVRARPPAMSDLQERLARLRQDLRRAIALVERGEGDEAADIVTTAYLTEFEPLEQALDRRDPRVRQSFERGLIDFRAALRRNDPKAAVATAKVLEEAADRAGEFLDSPAVRLAPLLAWIATLAAVVGVAVVVRLLIGNRLLVG